MRAELLRYGLADRLLAVGMAKVNRPVEWDHVCPWCRERCRDRAELVAHEQAHRLNEREAA